MNPIESSPAAPPSLERRSIHDDSCPSFQDALELIGRRWTGSILSAARQGASRFGDFRAVIDGISDRLLSQRLKELEAAGLIQRTVTPTTPVQIRYRLSQDGRALVDALQPLARWSLYRSGRGGGTSGPVA
ncbi:winged helix-turn-helix transcriptional regulator [Streptomyces sp. NPDC057062]|uniref:winged helix-turn-helix transcriptional regulator n=1 Tax=Streptomyces sp. NPDC057062 TaxID=3346011 RepID=UPI0036312BE4